MNPLIEVADYRPEWALQFRQIKEIILQLNCPAIMQVEHVGSTSVPGLAAKPILDIDLIIADKAQLPEVSAALFTLGYVHEQLQLVPDREGYHRLDVAVPWCTGQQQWMKQHLYVCSQESMELHNHLSFRNHLRNHPEAAAQYGILKKELAITSSDRLDYTNRKTEFVQRILQLYKKESS
ncbi:GrpB family protein [Paenibacillus sp. WLX1005]|uniref:GrpB family protein n=1 Tax=Paenibacillus sp. WLX1005 TaxID=3243766 RepID=UPI003983F970